MSTLSVPLADVPMERRAKAVRRKRSLGMIAGRVVLFVFAIYCALPIYWLLASSMKNSHQLFSMNGLLFPLTLRGLWDNLVRTFTFGHGEFGIWLGNSIIYSMAAALVGVGIAALAGYALAFHEFTGRRAVQTSILGAMMLPSSALVIPLYLIDVDLLHLQDSPLAFVLPSLVSPAAAYFMWTYYGRAVSRELLDAGRVDGATEKRLVWEVTRSVALPGALTMAVIVFIVTWNNFFLALIVLNSSGRYTATVGLVEWVTVLSGASAGVGSGAINYPQIITGALVSLVPLMALLVAMRRKIAAGMTLGSVKG